ncbi:hypothetical protein CDAR_15421 [Caerostris darwini]|uniref:LAGLIDADG homing endonuclease n=1 Tax=Caerostris darwini TaxID=1538125 RepID=A0AAV4S5K9_9ARAC|nr:hypothetical protein CDAR_15421 [Caerostris darwini]
MQNSSTDSGVNSSRNNESWKGKKNPDGKDLLMRTFICFRIFRGKNDLSSICSLGELWYLKTVIKRFNYLGFLREFEAKKKNVGEGDRISEVQMSDFARSLAKALKSLLIAPSF